MVGRTAGALLRTRSSYGGDFDVQCNSATHTALPGSELEQRVHNRRVIVIVINDTVPGTYNLQLYGGHMIPVRTYVY